MAGLTKKGEVYYALFSSRGKTKWHRIGKVSYRAAKDYIRKLESGSDEDRLGLHELTPITFEKASAQFLAYAKSNRADNTWKSYSWSIKALSKHFNDFTLETIDNEYIELYKAVRQEEGVSNRTINIELLCLQSMLKRAIIKKNLSRLPKIELLKVQKKPPRFLTESEMDSFLEGSGLWLYYILIVLRNSGMRSKSLKELGLIDANFDHNLLTVLNTKSNGFYNIFMVDELRTTLLYLKKHYVSPLGETTPRKKHQMTYFFCHPDGSQIGSFKTAFNKAVKRLGLKGVTPHTLRHTFASHLIMSGVDLRTVQELMGHKSIASTMIYSHLSEGHKAAAIQKLPWNKKARIKIVKDE